MSASSSPETRIPCSGVLSCSGNNVGQLLSIRSKEAGARRRTGAHLVRDASNERALGLVGERQTALEDGREDDQADGSKVLELVALEELLGRIACVGADE